MLKRILGVVSGEINKLPSLPKCGDRCKTSPNIEMGGQGGQNFDESSHDPSKEFSMFLEMVVYLSRPGIIQISYTGTWRQVGEIDGLTVH